MVVPWRHTWLARYGFCAADSSIWNSLSANIWLCCSISVFLNLSTVKDLSVHSCLVCLYNQEHLCNSICHSTVLLILPLLCAVRVSQKSVGRSRENEVQWVTVPGLYQWFEFPPLTSLPCFEGYPACTNNLPEISPPLLFQIILPILLYYCRKRAH